MPTARTLPLPPWFDPASAARFQFRPEEARLFDEATSWRRQHALTPSAKDELNVHLLLIDVQKDFCFPEGSLYVGGRGGRGAIDDSRRIAEFIYANLGGITNITTTLD